MTPEIATGLFVGIAMIVVGIAVHFGQRLP